jgi:glycerol kinase
MTRYVAAIDQGTTSTRFMVFDRAGTVYANEEIANDQLEPRPGWVEHDPLKLVERTREVVRRGLHHAGLDPSDSEAVGIANQRETSVVWDRSSGKPIYNAIVWRDNRTADFCHALAEEGGPDRFRARTGLPIAPYFSAPKVRWLLDHIEGARARAERGELLFGTVDTWLLWNLTGGPDGGVHATDATNASRTLLMDLATLDWDEEILDAVGVPRRMLPRIGSSAEVFGKATAPELLGVPIAALIGDQQADLIGQVCFSPGEAKNTYGSSNFVIMNVGTEPMPSTSGLLTSVGYRIGDEPAVYCLEGAIAVTGGLVRWLRDNLGLVSSADEVEDLARSVKDNGGCYFVPAFAGLFAPHWRSDARGSIFGLTNHVNKGHLARAVLEATAYQTKEVVDAMNADSGIELTSLKVDGGMVHNDLLMQFQADILNVPVIRPTVSETTSLGAACLAGLAIGQWSAVYELREQWGYDREWTPQMRAPERDRGYRQWKNAVRCALNWMNAEDEQPGPEDEAERADRDAEV